MSYRRIVDLAYQAAIELDNHSLGRGHGFKATEHLADFLERLSSEVSPTVVLIVWRAARLEERDTMRTVSDVYTYAKAVAAKLRERQGDISALRFYCVSLSQEALAECSSPIRYLAA